jgi:hypothetical protein
MNCAEAGGLILEARPSELEGSGDGILAQHIRDCEKCRGLARTVLEQEAAMGEELAAYVAIPDLDELLDRASEPEPSELERSGLEVRERMRRKARLRKAGFGLIPMAAAAVLAGLLLLEGPRLPGDPYSPPEPAGGLGVEVPEGQNVAVLATNNPNITVLWVF